MRRSLLLFATLLALPVAAQQLPTDLEPLPEPPPPPGMVDIDPALEPQITIIQRGEDRVEEYRINGKLYMLKVTPPHGRSYYLLDERGDGQMTRQENVDGSRRLSVPMWVIGTF